MLERRKLAAQLVRAQAMLWSADSPDTKARLQRFIHDIERRLLALDAQEAARPFRAPAVRPKPSV